MASTGVAYLRLLHTFIDYGFRIRYYYNRMADSPMANS